MKLHEKIQERLKDSPRTKSILQYLTFVVISAIFWGFLTFNSNVQLDVKVPVELTVPGDVHFLNKVPDTLTVTVRDRGYRFFTYWFHKTPKLTLRFNDYKDDGTSTFKVDQSHLKKALSVLLNRHAVIESVLPESINIRYTDQPGKKVPIKTDLTLETREGYTIYGALQLSQDSVYVYGDAKTLNAINEAYASHIEERNLDDTLRRKVSISAINGAVVEPRAVDLMVPVEKLRSVTRKVKIVVRNAPRDVKMLLFPSEEEVSFRSPVSRINDENENDIVVVVDYNSVDINHPSNKVKVMIGEMPAVYQNVKLSHDSVEYIIEKH